MKNLLTLIIVVLISTQVFSQDLNLQNTNNKQDIRQTESLGRTLTSRANGNWNSTSTWSPSYVPTINDIVIVNHNVNVNTTASCNQLTINSGKTLTINSKKSLTVVSDFINNGTFTVSSGDASTSTFVYLYGNITNNSGATIVAYGDYSRMELYGSSSQIFTNNGSITNYISSLGISNSNGVTFQNGNVPVFRINLFTGNVTGSNKLVLGDAVSSIGVIQRGESSNLNPAGTFDVSPTFNNLLYYYLLYAGANSETTIGNEVSENQNVYYLLSQSSNSVLNTKNFNITGLLNLASGQFKIASQTINFNSGNISVTSGSLTGGNTSYLIFNGTDTNTTYLPSVTLNSLTLNRDNGLKLSGDVSVTNTLTLTKGILYTQSNSIIFSNTAANPTETSAKRIEGIAVMNSRTIGTGSFNFLGAYFAAATQSLGYVTITRRTGSVAIGNGNGNASIACNWDIEAQNQPTNGRNMTYNWFSAYDNGIFFSNVNRGQVYYSTDNGLSWGPIGSLINPVVNTTDRSITINTTHYSRWSVGSEDGPLPVKLNSFTSSVSGNNVRLNWVTASETNNSGFEIYRSELNRNEFTKIGFISGKGNSNTVTNYSFEDKKLNSGKYEYKLKQIDYNGNYEFFKLNNSVEVNNPGKFTLSQNYPNPFNPVTKIDYSLPKNSVVKIEVYDITGKLIKTLVNETKNAGFYTVEFNANSISSGVFFYVMTADNFKEVKKLTIIK